MTLKEIKKAIKEGKKVYWTNDNYIIIRDKLGQYLIHSQCNNHYIGLTWADGETLNNNPSQYYIK